MTEIEAKALALVIEVQAEYPLVSSEVASNLALCRAIEQHEQFKREVSSVCEHLPNRPFVLDRFILPKPDPLVEALNEGCRCANGYDEEDADNLRAALAARGLKIVEVGNDRQANARRLGSDRSCEAERVGRIRKH